RWSIAQLPLLPNPHTPAHPRFANPANCRGPQFPVVSTTRKRAELLIMRSYAACAFSSGNVSVMGRTPVIAANFIVSSESIEEPEGHPYSCWVSQHGDLHAYPRLGRFLRSVKG